MTRMTIDWWTLGLQTVNVLILVWLLGRFFWRPVAAMIEQRRAAAQQTAGRGGGQAREAAAALAEIEQHARRLRPGARGDPRRGAREPPKRTRAALLAEAAKEAAALRSEPRRRRSTREREAAEKAWAERASRLAVDIAERLAARLDGPAVRDAFLRLAA